MPFNVLFVVYVISLASILRVKIIIKGKKEIKMKYKSCGSGDTLTYRYIGFEHL